MRLTALDAALLSMVLIWGANFSVIKYALRDFPESSFNALRLALASTVFLIAIRLQARHAARPPLTRQDWMRVVLLGVIGHLLYQVCFLAGVARTSVGNSSLIFGCTPVMVAILSAVAGHERIPLGRWLAAALSFGGIYLIVGHRATWDQTTIVGDVLVFLGMLCWSGYSVVSQPLLRRHSPLIVTGFSMTVGAVLYALMALPSFVTTKWSSISFFSWGLMVWSALFALGFAYIVWYTGVQRIGSSRTALYSNLTPIVAMIVAALTLGEKIGAIQVVGAIAILSGVFITRLVSAPPAAPRAPNP
jgi:drug/metabolite transporter (DMT)-like permease